MKKQEFDAGYIEPQTGRVAVLARDYANSDLNGDAAAYWYTPGAATIGLDPWRLIEGVDRHVKSDTMDIWFASGAMKTVGPQTVIFLHARDAARMVVDGVEQQKEDTAALIAYFDKQQGSHAK